MAVRYSGHMVQTRQQAAWLGMLMLAVLLPLTIWRATTLPARVTLPLTLVMLAPFAVSHRAWRFLEDQERLHADPTPGMTFAFSILANTPLTFGALMFVLLMVLD